MSEIQFPDQEAAQLALLMEREIDKRVALAVFRLLDISGTTPMGNSNIKTLEYAIDCGNMIGARNMMVNLIVQTVIQDGSLMNEVRRKIAEHLNKPMY